jgi:hypothetical protein
MDDLVKFLRARLDEDAEPCEGASEYVDCRDLSERRARDVEAKRRLVDEIVPRVKAMWWTVNSEWGCDPDDPDGEDILKILALPYADHPDYDEVWRP